MVPFLATDLPEISEDGLTYTVKLRDDAKWSDGKPIVGRRPRVRRPALARSGDRRVLRRRSCSTSSVRASTTPARTRRRPADADAAPTDRRQAREIGVTATDDHTVEFKLKRPVPWFDQLLTLRSFDAAAPRLVEKFGEKWTDAENIVSSGPFKLTEYKPSNHIVVTKNHDFWDADDVKLDKITFQMIGEPMTALREFERGRLDTGFQNTMRAGRDRPVEGRRLPRRRVHRYAVHVHEHDERGAQGPEGAPGARAGDRPSDIVDNITQERRQADATPSSPTASRATTSSTRARRTSSPERVPDLDKAKELLEEGGWEESTTLNIYYPSDSGNAGRSPSRSRATSARSA